MAGKYFFATQITSGGTGAWGKTAGTIPNRGNGGTITPGTSDQTIAHGYWRSNNTILGDTDLAAANIASGVTIFGVTGSATLATGNATEADVLAAKTFSKTGSAGLTGTMPTVALAAGSNAYPAGYHAGNAGGQTAVDSDLAAGNIADGITIFGVEGTLAGGGILKTGQTTEYTTDYPGVGGTDGCDGYYQKGTAFSYSWGEVDHNTVTDNVTGLIWASDGNGAGCYSGGTRTWKEAIAWAEGLDFAGSTEWRLPNRRELESLVNAEIFNPCINTTYFPNTPSTYYWSSTTSVDTTTYAWRVVFNVGIVDYDDKGNAFYARAVRGGAVSPI